MRTVVTGLVLAAALTATPAFAETITHKAAKISIDVPENWHSSTDNGGDVITLADKNENVAVTFAIVDAGAVKTAAKAAKHMLEKKIDKLTLTEPKDVSFNGMSGVGVQGDGFLNGVNIDLAIIVLDTPSDDHDLIIIALGEDAKLAKHMDEVKYIFNHLRPKK
jgi:hypothetical protein